LLRLRRTITEDLEKTLERLRKLEQENIRSVEAQLAASHRKILHELRFAWLTSVLKSIFAAVITSVVATAIIGPRHDANSHKN
jgi:hypothetical protein